MRIEIEIGDRKINSRYVDYKYAKPVIRDVCMEDPYKFVGLSLEEIREKFGPKTAQMVYDHAALGLGDLTKPPIQDHNPGYTEHVTIDLVIDSVSEAQGLTYIKVWLQPNPYRNDTLERCLWSGHVHTIHWENEQDEYRQHIIDLALKQLFR